ncbi:DUF317 domain-containing protein [Streptomyces sp. UH6]|uniref:DUF317 domain-containing protein n=1 Tax=Streptomyces sp. UH6 TaxID=2748379 RepID=UPI0015D49975|nr:DUF317 domain-containing protein [Streptomyces sp. UH6]NYV73314.1 DUF317 domain-containing protein [Streptomyces sp. UH6]
MPHPEDLDGDVYVSPRHLAGSTYTGDPALEPLREIGWDLHHDDRGNAYLNAPDGKVRLGYLPEGDDDGLWRINAYRDAFAPPAWGVCFNDSCPTEFVTAFTTTLAKLYQQGPESYLARPLIGSRDQDPFLGVVPLLRRGWVIDRPRWGVFAVDSPDGLAHLEYTTGDLDPGIEVTSRTARWHLWAGTSVNHPYWYATASTDTPVPLLAAVTDSVSDPAPVLRWQNERSSYQATAHVTPIVPPGPRVPTPLEAARSARRRPAAPATSSVPRWTTSTSRRALPGPRH